jgi:myo-inositol-1(or 4)-monophosphatase
VTFPEARQQAQAGQAKHAHDAGALLDVAVLAAREAAAIIREHARDVARIEWHAKAAADFVSAVDTEAERRIADVVHARHPGAVVLGEELSPRAVAEGLTFVVDPLDGTTNFLHGYPVYAVSIGVLVDGVLTAGVVLDVTRDSLCTATRGGGAWRDGARLAVSSITEPSRALVGTGFPFKHRQYMAPFLPQLAAVLGQAAGVRRAGAAALDLADVASGRFEAFWELMLAPWDVAAGVLLVREAGGVVTDLEGREASIAHGPIVAGSPAMHAWLLDLLRGAAPSDAIDFASDSSSSRTP